MDLEAGDKLGKYEIVSRIAAGGMAEVYLARSSGLGGFVKFVALKRMLPELACEPGFREMFMQEAAVAARLNHPNVVQIFDFAEENGELYIAMELVRGVTLRKLLADGLARGMAHTEARLSPLLSAYVCSCVARALDHAWQVPDEQGQPSHLIHRDVSPHNILISYEGDAKLADFGIARPAERRTSVGLLKGKLLYMAPEQIRGGPLDARADVFALGIVLYESAMSLPKPLFEGGHESEVKTAVQSRSVPPPSRMNPDFPQSLSSVIMKALERDPQRRFQSAAEMADALRASIHREAKAPQDYDLAAFMRRVYPEPPLLRAQRPAPSPVSREADRGAPARSALELCAEDPHAKTITREEAEALRVVAPPTPRRESTRCERPSPARHVAVAPAQPADVRERSDSIVPGSSRSRLMGLGGRERIILVCGSALALCVMALGLLAVRWDRATAAQESRAAGVVDAGTGGVGEDASFGAASAETPTAPGSSPAEGPIRPVVEQANGGAVGSAVPRLNEHAESKPAPVDPEGGLRSAVSDSPPKKVGEAKQVPGGVASVPSHPEPSSKTVKVERRRSGILIVYIKPWGNVWVDGETLTGKRDQEASPLLRRSLSTGKHVVHIQDPAGVLRDVNVVIKADRETRLEVPF